MKFQKNGNIMGNKLNVVISKPCLADWGKMTPCEQGRHCNSCDKTVIDFSRMTSEQTSSFIRQNLDKKICGNFNINQIDLEKCNKINLFFYRSNQFYDKFKSKCSKVMVVLTLWANLFLASCGNSDKPIESINPAKINDELNIKKPAKNIPDEHQPKEISIDVDDEKIEPLQIRGEVCAPEEPDMPPNEKK